MSLLQMIILVAVASGVDAPNVRRDTYVTMGAAYPAELRGHVQEYRKCLIPSGSMHFEAGSSAEEHQREDVKRCENTLDGIVRAAVEEFADRTSPDQLRIEIRGIFERVSEDHIRQGKKFDLMVAGSGIAPSD